ncbi:MAG: 50S ribosomal protein L9 [Candidatus Dadabacteria bacterium]|nr:MAG: 50S ribosomal protein L9 [Candidatus Dadabacteria bacterium]
MEVILQKDYPSLGFVGERVKVKAGYARNFLIPKGIALEASSRRAKELEHKLAGILAKKRRLKAQAEELARRMSEGGALIFELKAGEKGKSFGAISARDISDRLRELGFEVERKQVKLSEPLKSGGIFKVPVKLHSEVEAELEVKVEVVVPKKGKEEEGKEEKAAKGKRKKGKKAEAKGGEKRKKAGESKKGERRAQEKRSGKSDKKSAKGSRGDKAAGVKEAKSKEETSKVEAKES